MQIKLNNKTINCPEGINLTALIEEQGIPTRHIAIALNNTVIRRADWDERQIKEGDEILVIGAIKGG